MDNLAAVVRGCLLSTSGVATTTFTRVRGLPGLGRRGGISSGVTLLSSSVRGLCSCIPRGRARRRMESVFLVNYLANRERSS